MLMREVEREAKMAGKTLLARSRDRRGGRAAVRDGSV